ncbi:MAG TPA: ELM1/GtrOC1 family putative glycosyltransferase [Sphingomicrobium sp.]|nr:ELM1/GtrOC1 family putative glycosyltransferase [Sphingomicrobium sp.]
MRGIKLTNHADKSTHRVWALLGARAGDNDQVIALAEALGSPFTAKPLHYNALQALGPRLLGSSLASLRLASRESLMQDPPPDLTISTGHRSVAVVRALRLRSGGQMRSIHLGFPRVSPAEFDLVITTPQYAIGDHPNVLRIPYALTRTVTDRNDEGSIAKLESLPSPKRLLIVGGPTLFWNLDREKLLQTLDAMLMEASADGGSVLVTTSPRTPGPLRKELASVLSKSGVSTLLAEPGQPPTYPILLLIADSIRVTADSVSMVSDAIWTRKPLALIPIALSRPGRVIFALHDWLRPGSRVYPQDLRFFWDELGRMGITDKLALPTTTRSEMIAAVKARLRPLLAAT